MPSVFNSTRWPTTRAHADAGGAASRGIVVAAKQLAILAAVFFESGKPVFAPFGAGVECLSLSPATSRGGRAESAQLV
jgi:hypothetical protein